MSLSITRVLTIDARYLAQPPSGIPRYTANLLDAIRRADPGRAVRVVTHPQGPLPETLANHGPFDIVLDGNTPRSPGEMLRWRSRLKQLQPSVLHSPDVFAPLWPGPKVAITLHDVIPLLPELSRQTKRSKKQRLRPIWRAWLKRQTRRADAVLTVSQYSADDLRQLLGVPASKLHVVPNAVPAPHEHANHSEPSPVPYLLCVGRFDPYKNAVGLVDAFARLPEPLQLIFVGPLDPRFPEAQQRVAELGLDDRVIFRGAVDDGELHALYAHAAALVMPSRYEGFGLPAIEAMHHGVPVVTSNAGSLPEIVGNAAVVTDATNLAALSAAIASVLNNETKKNQLIAAGRSRVLAFSSQRIGTTYLDVIDRLAATS
ncbi:MAG: glycosyltransferase family 1 protein [Planctomycetota bacterium]